jgi:hypothetical protein
LDLHVRFRPVRGVCARRFPSEHRRSRLP